MKAVRAVSNRGDCEKSSGYAPEKIFVDKTGSDGYNKNRAGYGSNLGSLLEHNEERMMRCEKGALYIVAVLSVSEPVRLRVNSACGAAGGGSGIGSAAAGK